MTGDSDDANAPALSANLQHLRAAKDARGRTLDVVEVKAPTPRYLDDGRQQSLSYLNFYLANEAVIMPCFGDPMDDAAYRTIAKAFAPRMMIDVDASALILGGGGIHCITQQQPRVAR